MKVTATDRVVLIRVIFFPCARPVTDRRARHEEVFTPFRHQVSFRLSIFIRVIMSAACGRGNLPTNVAYFESLSETQLAHAREL